MTFGAKFVVDQRAHWAHAMSVGAVVTMANAENRASLDRDDGIHAAYLNAGGRSPLAHGALDVGN